MTREQKLALIVGFALVLVVGVLVSDHLSLAQKPMAEQGTTLDDALDPGVTPGLGRKLDEFAIASPRTPSANTRGRPIDQSYFTIEPAEERSSQAIARAEPTDSALDAIARNAERVTDFMLQTQNNPAAAQPEVWNNSPRATSAASRTPRTPHKPTRSLPKPKQSDAVVHTVRKGESLWKIAQRYYGDGGHYLKLAEYNKDRTGDEGTVYAGATILVPPLSELTGDKSAPDFVRQPKPRPEAKPSTYTVRSGDTLGEISQDLLGTSKRWQEILEANSDKLEDEHGLQVGMVIRIPAE